MEIKRYEYAWEDSDGYVDGPHLQNWACDLIEYGDKAWTKKMIIAWMPNTFIGEI